VTVTGVIKNDGTFSLDTIRESKRSAGAPQGTYLVTIAPTTGEGQLTAPVTLPQPCVVAPQDNEFHLRIDRPQRRR